MEEEEEGSGMAVGVNWKWARGHGETPTAWHAISLPLQRHRIITPLITSRAGTSVRSRGPANICIFFVMYVCSTVCRYVAYVIIGQFPLYFNN